jgi:hypothetical protein
MSKLEEKDWRRLCELVAKETDPHKLPELLEQLTEALDACAKKLNVHSNRRIHRAADPSRAGRSKKIGS